MPNNKALRSQQKVRKQNSLSETKSPRRKRTPNPQQLGRNMYKQKLKLHGFHHGLPIAGRETMTQLVHRKASSYLYSGYLKSWPGSCLPTTFLPSHLAKPIPDSKVRRKSLKGLAKTGVGGRGKKIKGISCLLLWEDLCLLPFSGLSKLAEHIPCKWLRRRAERSKESPVPQAKHRQRGSVDL